MKLLYLAIIPALMLGSLDANAAHAKKGEWQERAVHRLFGDKDTITKDDFIKQAGEKFDKIDTDKKGVITKDQFKKFLDEKMKMRKEEMKKAKKLKKK